ncbi:hypothetical protein BsWGS_15377 [Bradybaena similaris]
MATLEESAGYHGLENIIHGLYSYYSFFLLLAGCVCNPLSFIVFSRKAFRQTTMSVYLRILAISDLGVILNGFLPYVTVRALGINLRANNVACSVSMVVHFLLLYASSWILVIVTVERVVSILWPQRRKAVFVDSNCMAVMIFTSLLVIFGPLSLLCSFEYKDMTVTSRGSNYTEVFECVSFNSQDGALPLFIADCMMFAFVPSVVLIVCNFFIVHAVVESRKRVMKIQNTVITTTTGPRVYEVNDGNHPGIRTQKADVSNGALKVANIKSPVSSIKNRMRSAKETSLTLMLVTISTTFIICNFPICAFGFWVTFVATPGRVEAVINDLLFFVMYTNNCLNFFLYCINGTKFRAEVVSFLKDIALWRRHL